MRNLFKSFLEKYGDVGSQIFNLFSPFCPSCLKADKLQFRHNHCSLCEGIGKSNRSDDLRKNFTDHGLDEKAVREATWVCETCFQNRFQHHRCSLCESITETNRANDLRQNFIEHEHVEKVVQDATWVCEACFKKKYRSHHCRFCNTITKINRAHDLKKNFAAYGQIETLVSNSDWVCSSCYDSKFLTRCFKTKHVFEAKDNRMLDYRKSKFLENLTPYHPDSRISVIDKHKCLNYYALSPAGFLLIELEHDAFLDRLKTWVGGTKEERIRGYHIKEEIRTVRCDQKYEDKARVEAFLKWFAAQTGGNGYIKFGWDKHSESREEKEVAGYGPKGNPHYRTRRYTIHYYTGHAVAVIAERLDPNNKKEKKARH